MYILSWNPEQSRLEASFGGRITKGEAEAFYEELRDRLLGTPVYEVVVDYAMVRRLDDGVETVFEEARQTSRLSGVRCVTFVVRDELEADFLTGQRLQEVLNRTEQYVAFRLAA